MDAKFIKDDGPYAEFDRDRFHEKGPGFIPIMTRRSGQLMPRAYKLRWTR